MLYMLSVISFREETLDLPGHGHPEGAAPSPLLAAGLPRARLAPHGVVHSLRDLYLHLLVCLVWPQPLTLAADHPLGLDSASVSALRPPLGLWGPRGVDADPRRCWAGRGACGSEAFAEEKFLGGRSPMQ